MLPIIDCFKALDHNKLFMMQYKAVTYITLQMSSLVNKSLQYGSWNGTSSIFQIALH